MAHEDEDYRDLLKKRDEILHLLEAGGSDSSSDDEEKMTSTADLPSVMPITSSSHSPRSSSRELESPSTGEKSTESTEDMSRSSSSADMKRSASTDSFDEPAKKQSRMSSEGPMDENSIDAMDDIEALEELLERPVDEGLTDDTIWKTVLEKLDDDPFNKIPSGWTQITHNCGMPVFLHKASRVVTFSRPYQLSSQSIRSHNIPISAVPCLYRLKLDEIHRKKEEERLQPNNSSGLAAVLTTAPTAQVEKPEDYMLSSKEMTDYCAKRFKFTKILIKSFNKNHDKHLARSDRKQKILLQKQGIYDGVDELVKDDDNIVMKTPSGGKLLNIPVINGKYNRKSHVINPMNKSSVNILNEYTNRAMKGRMDYVCEDNRSTQNPYKATAYLTIEKSTIVQLASTVREKLEVLREKAEMKRNQSSSSSTSSQIAMLNAAAAAAGKSSDDEKRIPIGRGFGSSKKVAKLAAAKDALEYLIPSLRINDTFVVDVSDEKRMELDKEAKDMMDKLKIESKSVPALCNQSNQTKPMALLKEILKTSIRWSGMSLNEERAMAEGQMSTIVLTLGELKAEARARGMKIAGQMAAQKMLKLMHPEIETYGSLLRLYTDDEVKETREEAKKHHHEIVRLQGKGNLLLPNMAVINKLKEEMSRVPIYHPARKIDYYGIPTECPFNNSQETPTTTETCQDTSLRTIKQEEEE